MDLQSRKIEFIQEFLKIHSEEVISRLEKVLKKGKSSTIQEEIKLTSEQKKAIDKGLLELKEGKGISHEEVMKDLKREYSAL